MAKSFNEIFESFGSVMELLRDDKFQDLLVNYQRAKKVFLVGYEVQDEVSSEVLFEGVKPEDYLLSFSKFVKEKETEIEAIAILLNKPKEWNTKALNELRKKLRENHYSEEKLQKAHNLVYHKNAVDVISMIKHAAKESEPLLTVDERVNSAVEKVIYGKQLTDDQQKWIAFIKEHLKYNLTIEEDDLKELPVFTDRGGLGKFKKVFPGEFDKILSEINIAIAA